MRENLHRAVDSELIRYFTRDTATSFSVVGDSWHADFTVQDNQLQLGGEPIFSLTAPDKVWETLTATNPQPGSHSLVHLVRRGTIRLAGDELSYQRHVHLVRALLDATKQKQDHFPISRPLSARGEYHRLRTSLGLSDIYVERAGSGRPVLAFATAGSDTSQWHGVMTASDFTDRYELITVDLPWHGKSSPAWGSPVGSYKLSPESYTEFIVAMADILGLKKPVLIGISMAGAAVVHAIATQPHKFRGAVACQAGTSVQSRTSALHRNTAINPSLFIPEWTYGLMNPASPEEFKQRVWWSYSSGGYGLYAADIESYSNWDFSLIEHRLLPESPHIAVLSGVFDTSVPPEQSRELADRIPNSSFKTMPELGHFPHAENPPVFARYLEDAIFRVMTAE